MTREGKNGQRGKGTTRGKVRGCGTHCPLPPLFASHNFSLLPSSAFFPPHASLLLSHFHHPPPIHSWCIDFFFDMNTYMHMFSRVESSFITTYLSFLSKLATPAFFALFFFPPSLFVWQSEQMRERHTEKKHPLPLLYPKIIFKKGGGGNNSKYTHTHTHTHTKQKKSNKKIPSDHTPFFTLFFLDASTPHPTHPPPFYFHFYLHFFILILIYFSAFSLPSPPPHPFFLPSNNHTCSSLTPPSSHPIPSHPFFFLPLPPNTLPPSPTPHPPPL